ncbi:MAG TPA: OpgC domain-containing protein [Chthoniobacterales bacterium]
MDKSPRGARDTRIDTLRGLFLAVMAVNHIPSELHPWTDHSLGFFSSAEGFFFLSGLLAGRVYTRRRDRDGAPEARVASWKRAAVIYGAHLVTFFVVFAGILTFARLTGTAPGHAPALLLEHPWQAAGAALLLALQPPLFDILPLYAGFMLLLPGLLALYARGWQFVVFAASVAIWFVGYAWVPPVPADAFATHAFPWTAWQLPLVVGSVCGNFWATGRTGLFVIRPGLLVTAGLVCAGCFIVRHAYVPPPVPIPILEAISSKNFLGPLRVLNVAAAFYLLLAAARWLPRLLEIRPLAFLGKHTLPVFCAHIVAAYVIYAFPGTFDESAGGRWLGTGVILAVMFVAAWAHESWKKRGA